MVVLFPALPVFGAAFVRLILWSIRFFGTEIVKNDEFRTHMSTKIKDFLVDHFDRDDSKIMGVSNVTSDNVTRVSNNVFRKHIVDTLFTEMLPDVLPELDNVVGVPMNDFDNLADEKQFLTTTGNNLLLTQVIKRIMEDSDKVEGISRRFNDFDGMEAFFKKININFHIIDNVIKVSAYDPSYIDKHEEVIKLNLNRKIYPVGVMVGISILQRQDDDTYDNQIDYGYTEANNFSSYSFLTEEFKIAPRLSARLNSKFRSSIHAKFKNNIASKKQNFGYILNKNNTAVLPTSYDLGSLEGMILQTMQTIFQLGSSTISGPDSVISNLFPKNHPDGVLYRDNIVSNFEIASRLDFNLNNHADIARKTYKMAILSSVLPIIKTWRSVIVSGSSSNKFDRRNLYFLSKKFDYSDDDWLRDIYRKRSQFSVLKNHYKSTADTIDTNFIQQVKEEIIDFIKDENNVNKSWLDSWFGSSEKPAQIDLPKQVTNKSINTPIDKDSSDQVMNTILEQLKGS